MNSISSKTNVKSNIKPPPPPSTLILDTHTFDDVALVSTDWMHMRIQLS